MIGEEIVGVSLVWRFEVMVDGHCWVMFGVVGYCWVRFEVGHFREEAVVAVDC